jgi:AraC family transcriptional regulator
MDHPLDTAAPRLMASSDGLGWRGVEARTYRVPDESEHWYEDAASHTSLMLLTGGAVHLLDCDSRSCPGFHVRYGDLFLTTAHCGGSNLRWKSLSAQPVQMLRVHLNHALFERTLAELTARDPQDVTLIPRAAFRDTLLLQLSVTLGREIDSPSPMSPLYAETTGQMLAVHLLRHYTNAALPINRDDRALSPAQIRRVTDYVREHLTQALTLEEMAAQTGYSPYHFARLFRQAVGESPHQFVVRQRIEQAQHLLRQTDTPISQIAVATGFAHQSHLTHVFRRLLGVTPRAYRDEC